MCDIVILYDRSGFHRVWYPGVQCFIDHEKGNKNEKGSGRYKRFLREEQKKLQAVEKS